MMGYVIGTIYFVYLIVRYFLFPEHEMTVWSRCMVPFLIVPMIFYDSMILEEEEEPSERYFGFLYWGQLFWVTPLISVFTKGVRPDDIFIVPNLLLIPFTFICAKSNRKHQTYFVIFGIATMILWLGDLLLHPVLAGADVNVPTILLSLKFNIGYFIFAILFFFGNWAKLGLFENSSVHRKCFFWLMAMYAISIFARQPELAPFLDRVPLLGDKLASAGATGVFVFPSVMGFIFPHKGKNVIKEET